MFINCLPQARYCSEYIYFNHFIQSSERQCEVDIATVMTIKPWLVLIIVFHRFLFVTGARILI